MLSLIFVPKVGKLRGACGCEVPINLYCVCSQMKKHNSTTFYLTCDHFRYMRQPYIGIKLGFHWRMTHVKVAKDVVHLHIIDQ